MTMKCPVSDTHQKLVSSADIRLVVDDASAVDHLLLTQHDTSLVVAKCSGRYTWGDVPIGNLQELLRPCSWTSERSPRPLLRGQVVEHGLTGVPRRTSCVIKLMRAVDSHCTDALKGENDKHNWLQERALRKGKVMLQESLTFTKSVPGCIHWYYFHNANNLSYAVVEDHYRDVRALLYDTPGDTRRADYRVLTGMLKALQSLHSINAIHGHIRPENILYRVDGEYDCEVKFCDLRFACPPGEDILMPPPVDCCYLPFNIFHAACAKKPVKAAAGMDVFAIAVVMWQILQRSSTSFLTENSDFYGEKSSAAPADWIMNKVNSYSRPDSYVHFLGLLNEMFAHSNAVDVRDVPYTTFLRLLKDLEPVDKVLAELRLLRTVMDRVEKKVDTVLQTVEVKFGELQSNLRTCARAAASSGARNAETLEKISTSMSNAAHDLSAAMSTGTATSEQIQRSILSSLEEIKTGLGSHALDSSVDHADLLQQFKQGVLEITDQVNGIRGEGSTALGELLKIGASLLKSSNNIQLELIQTHADLKAIEVAQERGRKATCVTMHSLLTGEQAIPTLFVLLPELSDAWADNVSPMRFVRNRYRLYFVCEHTHQIVCGPDREGFLVEHLQNWVVEAAPYVQTALIAVSVALLACGIPVPFASWCKIPKVVTSQAKYLCAAFAFAEDAEGSTAGAFTAEHLAAMGDLSESDLRCGYQDRARASEIVQKLMAGHTGWRSTCGLVLVSCETTGHSAWVLDLPITKQAWRDAWPQRLTDQIDALVYSLLRGILAIAKVLQYDLLLSDAVKLRVDNLTDAVRTAQQRLTAQPGPPQLLQTAEGGYARIEQCFAGLISEVAGCVQGVPSGPLTRSSLWFNEQVEELRGELIGRLEFIRLRASSRHADALQKVIALMSTALARLENELVRCVNEARCLRELHIPTTAAIAGFQPLFKCVALVTDPGRQRDCPQLPLLLPRVGDDWEGPLQPFRLQKNKCRLLFLCSHTKLPVPCGLDGWGHYITADATSRDKLMPLMEISLLVLKGVLVRPECTALPPALIDARLDTKELQVKYLDAVLELMIRPEHVPVRSYFAPNAPKYDATKLNPGLLVSRADGAYAELRILLQRHNLRSSDWGMRRYGNLWITDSDEAEAQMAAEAARATAAMAAAVAAQGAP
jgi:hypothetical protein